MKNLNYQRGKIGEELAKKYLEEKGYQILLPNFRTRFGEIDLIAAKNNLLVFVEVKLKREENLGKPEEMITQQKIRKIQQAAEYFLTTNPQIAQKYLTYQIDAVCIVLSNDGSPQRITHWKNING